MTQTSSYVALSKTSAVQPERSAAAEGNFYAPLTSPIGPGMNPRVQRLRKLSFEAEPSLSIERALIETEFYKEHNGKHSVPVMRALVFLELCKRKTLYLAMRKRALRGEDYR